MGVPSNDTLKLFTFFLVFRVINALLIDTFHVPDEYWQSIEVAHRFVFGYGFLTWEWQPQTTLRSFLHPMVFAILYKILQITHLDTMAPATLIYGPRILQAVFAAIGDIALYSFVSRTFGRLISYWFIIAQLSNWFLLHNLTRTLANSIETILISIFLNYWPVFPSTLHKYDKRTLIYRRRIALLIAGVCFLFRPTSAVFWAFFAVFHLIEASDKYRFLIEAVVISSSVLIIGTILDAWYYGALVSPLVQFVRFNFLTEGANHYGSHPVHWYLSIGIPTLFGPLLIPLFVSLASIRQFTHEKLLLCSLFCIVAFTYISHKEARFLMPLIPIIHVYVAKGLAILWSRQHVPHPFDKKLKSDSRSPPAQLNFPSHLTLPLTFFPNTRSDTQEPPKSIFHASHSQRKHKTKISEISSSPLNVIQLPIKYPSLTLRRSFVILIIAASIAIGIYTSSIHQRGTIDVMNFIRDEPSITEVFLMMPCHHTPGLTYIHRPDFVLDYLDCSPGLPQGELDEADQFYQNPKLFLQEHFDPSNEGLSTYVKYQKFSKDSGLKNQSLTYTKSIDKTNQKWYYRLPKYIVMYNTLKDNLAVNEWLETHRYVIVKEFFHAHAASGRVGNSVLLLEKQIG